MEWREPFALPNSAPAATIYHSSRTAKLDLSFRDQSRTAPPTVTTASGMLLRQTQLFAMPDWNQCYIDAQTPWDKGQPSPPLREYLERHPLRAGRVLVPGCGVGHDAAFIAAQGAEVIGLDIAPLAIERARAAYPQLPAAMWRVGDLFSLDESFGPNAEAGSTDGTLGSSSPLAEACFDAVVEHTCFCAIEPSMRPAYVATMLRLLKPGGRLIGIWFLDPEMDPGEAGPPFGTPVSELDERFSEGFRIVYDAIPATAFPGRAGRERLRVLERVGPQP
jgi:methyl halide transferase